MASKTIFQQKQILRKSIKKTLKSISNEEIMQQSQKIALNLFGTTLFQQSKSLCLYLEMPHEVSTKPILEKIFAMNKRVYTPLVTGPKSADMKMLRVYSIEEIESFPKSNWGIPEPPEILSTGEKRPNALEDLQLDLILLPGVGFDSSCQRLGHGKGYYDCFLSTIQGQYTKAQKRCPQTIGIAFNEQIVSEVPTLEHDRRLTMVVTPNTIYQ